MNTERIPKYKIGDKVKLNVGGPDMAINRVIDEKNYQTQQTLFSGIYGCQWFAGKKLDSGSFPEESLIPIQENKGDDA